MMMEENAESSPLILYRYGCSVHYYDSITMYKQGNDAPDTTVVKNTRSHQCHNMNYLFLKTQIKNQRHSVQRYRDEIPHIQRFFK